jgi:fused signal recognition particle receptor
MKKMSRVISPDLKLYIGESIAGSAILDQVQSFNREIGLDGVILTKLDCDPKGGTMLSLSKVTGIPIVAVTLGQKYDDIEVFDPQKIAKKIVS